MDEEKQQQRYRRWVERTHPDQLNSLMRKVLLKNKIFYEVFIAGEQSNELRVAAQELRDLFLNTPRIIVIDERRILANLELALENTK